MVGPSYVESASSRSPLTSRSGYTLLPTVPDGGLSPLHQAGWVRLSRTVPISLALTLFTVAGIIAWVGSHEVLSKSRLGTPVEMKAESNNCGLTEDDMDYWTKGSLYQRNYVTSAHMCRMHCEGDPQCGAWTWGKTGNMRGMSDVCFLKALGRDQLPKRQPKLGVVSGLRCQLLGEIAAERSSSSTAAPSLDPSESSGGTGSTDNAHPTAAAIGRGDHPSQSAAIMSKTSESSTTSTTSGTTTSSTTRTSSRTTTGTTSTTSTTSGTDTDTTSTSHTKTTRTTTTTATTATTSTIFTTTLNTTTTSVSYPPGSLFCFSLMLPGSYEQGLLSMQHKEHVSIFACDQYAIYSNTHIVIAPGVHTLVIDSDLHCEKGGEFRTALNLDIFIAVWTKVISDGVFLAHDWTVKVDPDAVFFPALLREVVGRYSGDAGVGNGVYLNNCKFGMHGPLEVFSVNAVKAWGMGSTHCVKHFEKLCNGPCYWGEDMFIDQCLWKVLDVKRVNEYRLLTEDHCDPPEGWQDCSNKTQVAFHPFKTLHGYRQCLANAMS